jgi:hypothetical protein
MATIYRLSGTIEPSIDINAPVSVRSSMDVHAPIDRVWNILTDFGRWPEWNSAVTEMEPSGPVGVGMTFRWRAGSVINSQVFRVTPPTVIAWTGRTMGIDAVHVWRLAPSGLGTTVTTEESFQSMLVRLFPRYFHRMLTGSLDTVLRDLKRAAER